MRNMRLMFDQVLKNLQEKPESHWQGGGGPFFPPNNVKQQCSPEIEDPRASSSTSSFSALGHGDREGWWILKRKHESKDRCLARIPDIPAIFFALWLDSRLHQYIYIYISYDIIILHSDIMIIMLHLHVQWFSGCACRCFVAPHSNPFVYICSDCSLKKNPASNLIFSIVEWFSCGLPSGNQTWLARKSLH